MRYLLEIDTPFTPDITIWRAPGIPEIKLAGLIDKVYPGITIHYDGVPQIYADNIVSARIGTNVLFPMSTFAKCNSAPGSFYFGKDRNTVNVNIAKYSGKVPVVGHQTITGKRIVIGIIVGFCDRVDYSRGDKAYYGGNLYRERIKSLPTINAKRDSMFYGRQAFNAWQIPLNGGDGELDAVEYRGCFCRILALPDGGEREDGVRVMYGKATDISGGDETTIAVDDMRWQLEKDASLGTFETDVFPHLAKSDIGKKIPIYINKHTGISPICVNRAQDLSGSLTKTYDYCAGATPDVRHAIYGIDRVYTRGDSGTVSIAAGFSYETNYLMRLNRRDKGNLSVSVMYGKTENDLKNSQDYTVTPVGDGFYYIKLHQTIQIPNNSVSITITADSDDNDGIDIEADVSKYSVKLVNVITGIATVSVPASIALADGDSPMDIRIDLFGWYNTISTESKWLNAADIMADALYMFSGFRFDENSFDLINWQIEREKIRVLDVHLSPKIEDSKSVNDLLNEISQSSRVVITNRSDSLFDIRLDTEDNMPSFTLTQDDLLDAREWKDSESELVSKLTITYGTDSESKLTYTTKKSVTAQIEAENITKEMNYDFICSDEESVEKIASHIENRSIDIHKQYTFKFRATDDLRKAWFTQSFYGPKSRDGSQMAAFDILSISIPLGDTSITVIARHRWDVEYDYGYVQGALCGDFMCNDIMPAATEYIEEI